MDDISDEELRRRLTVDYKMDCPPVTGATRKVMLRKLMHLEQQAGRSFRGDNNSVQVEDLVICDESEDSNDEESDTTRELVIDESVIANGSPRYNTEQALRTPSSNRQSLRRKTHSEMDAIKTFNVSLILSKPCTSFRFLLSRKLKVQPKYQSHKLPRQSWHPKTYSWSVSTIDV